MTELPQNNRTALRRVVRACRKAALATVMRESAGAPYASLVTVALDHDLSPILLLSGLSDHARNIEADSRVSLLFDGTDGHPNPQTGPRVTLMGQAETTEDDRLKRRFLARHPGAAMYAGFGDFRFWRIRPLRAHFVGGFGRAVWFEAPFGIAPATAESFARAEDFTPRETADGWSVVATDPDGADLARGEGVMRISFPTPLEGPDGLEGALAANTQVVKR